MNDQLVLTCCGKIAVLDARAISVLGWAMHPFNLLQRTIALAGLAILFLACPAQSADGLRTFRSKSSGYEVQYPISWYGDATGTTDTLNIDNFPASKAIRAVHIPAGGAEIMLAPAEAGGRREKPRTLEAWVEMDNPRNSSLAKRTFDIEGPRRMLSIIEVKKQCCAVPPFFESVHWYFEFEGRLFGALLTYWKDDQNVDKLRETLKQVVLTLRVTGPKLQ